MNNVALEFQLEAVCPWSGARAGTMITRHGIVQTPVFMPVGTNATIKALLWNQLEDLEAQIVLANSYHLFLRPGHHLIESAGGLHKFMSWPRPILTDSGGFQIFSLDALRKINDQGVHFKDHLSGIEHFIGPEKSMEIQNALGADIIMAFDECVKNPASYQEAKAALERTHLWLDRCIDAHKRPCDQALFGIVQGSIYEDLREASCKTVNSLDLPGYAIGGVAVGENRQEIEKIVAHTARLLPQNKPRYLMGVGTPWDIAYAVSCGVDMFDCVLPTRLARHGSAFISSGRISLRNASFANDFQPLDKSCSCFTCIRHTRAYLHHLVRLKEMAAASLLSIHNIFHLQKQSLACRQAILDGKFKEYFEAQTSLCGRLP